MTLGPRTLKAIAEAPQLWSDGPEHYNGKEYESPQDFARRVALIAQEEERERWNEIVKVCNTFREMCDKLSRGPL